MKPIIKDLILFMALSLIIFGAVEGSLYARRTWQEGQKTDALLKAKQDALNARAKSAAEISSELDSAKSLLAEAAARLADMKVSYNTSVYDSLGTGTRQELEKALRTVSALADNANNSGLEKARFKDVAVAARVDRLERQIDSLVTAWKSGQTVPDILAIQQSIAELRNIISGLTPDDSGLTQAEIDDYLGIVSSAENVVDNAIESSGVSSGSSSGSSSNPSSGSSAASGSSGSAGSSGSSGTNPPVTPAEIQAQQDAVNAALDNVTNLQDQLSNASSDNGGSNGQGGTGDQSGGGSSNGSSSGGNDSYYDQYVPPPPPDMSGKPRLIEGTNAPSETPK